MATSHYDGDAASKFAAAGQPASPLNAWLKISADNTITCGIHRAEMGQGITTALSMLLIEKLDADWDDVRFEFVPVDRDYFNFGMLLNGQPLGTVTTSPGGHFTTSPDTRKEFLLGLQA